jgi:hypothetical protein
MPHPIFTLLAAVVLSLAMAMVENRPPRERLYVAARVLLCCTMTTLGGSWLMHLIHG